MTPSFRTLRHMLRTGDLRRLARRASVHLERTSYAYWLWMQHRRHGHHELAALGALRTDQQPRVSLVLYADALTPQRLRICVRSITAQRYPHWDLYIVLTSAADPRVAAMVASLASTDPRISVCTAPDTKARGALVQTICATANGQHIVFLNCDGVLARSALEHVAAVIVKQPGVQLIYSDEDERTAWGRRIRPTFKPDWSPHLLRSYHYVSQLLVMSSTLARQLAPCASGSAQDCDAHAHFVRISGQVLAQDIVHIRRVLYHRLPGTPHTPPALFRWPERPERDAPPPDCRVSIIIPTRDQCALLQSCIDGLLHHTDYVSLEVIVVDNNSSDADALAYLAKLAGMPRVRVLNRPEPFNFAALCNAGARASSGDVFCFLNNDIEVRQAGWLRELTALALQPDIGAAGPLLRYPDGRIQHMGIRLNGALPRLIGDGLPPDKLSESIALKSMRNVSALTGACLVTRRAAFDAAGGFDEAFPVAYNDVDLCLSLRAAGYWIVWTPFAELVHKLSATRGVARTDADRARHQRDIERLRAKWPDALGFDPFVPERADDWPVQ